jgi:hypothetical protein
MRRLSRALLTTVVLAGCAPVSQRPHGTPPVTRPPVVVTPPRAPAGLEAVIGHDARALIALFGMPGLDAREGPARKLQFLGRACVLDAYLYPPRAGAEPVVAYVDTRLPDGRDTDKAGCVEALSRR